MEKNKKTQVYPGNQPAKTEDQQPAAQPEQKVVSRKAADGAAKKAPQRHSHLAPYVVDDTDQALTTNQGLKMDEDEFSLKAGERGPTLMQDFHFREKITHFDHERIPERIVHARGVGAHGVFRLEKDMSQFTRAGFLTQVGKETPVFLRFSTVQGSRGSNDICRDVRGVAIKFYTEEGNYDLVGNNIPVFFIQDALKFPDFVHAVKPEPHTEVPQAGSAHDTLWDFVANNPETAHAIMWAMSDRTIPRSLRMMEAFGVHTFRWVNAQNEAVFVKYHFKPVLGVHSFLWDENQKVAGKDFDFHRRDLYDALDQGNYPEWEVGVQIVPEEDEFKFDFDLLDPTKIIPEEEVPVTFFGRLILNRNVENFFAETEQAAFHPGHVVPGIDFTNDPLLQGRLFSYTDTQLIRLGGPNFHQIPINRPIAPIHNNQRDGYHQHMIHAGPVSYHRNSLNGNDPHPVPQREGGYQAYQQKVEGNMVRARSESFLDFYSQARLFFDSLSQIEQQHVEEAFVFELNQVKSKDVRQQAVDMFAHVHAELAARIAQKIGVQPPRPGHKEQGKKVTPRTKASAALSQMNGPAMAKTLKVGLVVGSTFDAKLAANIISALQKEGAACEVIGPHAGDINGLEAKFGYQTTSPVLYDAMAILSYAPDPALKDVVAEYAQETFKHLKPLGLTKDTLSLLEADKQSAPGVVDVANDLSQFLKDLNGHKVWARDAFIKKPSAAQK